MLSQEWVVGTQPLKVIMIGASGVGKSALLRQWCYNDFNKDLPKTMVTSVGLKEVKVDNLKVTMEIWDQAASRAATCTDIYITADICVLVYDICCTKSFEELENWMDEFLAGVQNPQNFPFVIAGNKYDATEEQAVSDAAALTWCKAKRNNVRAFCKTSAATGEGVEKTFMSVVRYALQDGAPALKRAKKIIQDEGERIRLLQEEHGEESEDIAVAYEEGATEVAVAIATVERAVLEKVRKQVTRTEVVSRMRAQQTSMSSSGHVA